MSTITPLTVADKADTVEIWIESFYDYPAMRQCFIGHARNKQEYDDWLRIFLDLLFDVSFYLGGPLLGARGDDGSLLGALAGYDTDWGKEWPDVLQNIYADFSESIGVEGVRRLEQYEAVNDEQHPPQSHYCVDIVGVLKNHLGNGYAK
jgi:hypothetical protein